MYTPAYMSGVGDSGAGAERRAGRPSRRRGEGPGSGAVMGAPVTLTNQRTKVKTTTSTDAQGAYTFSAVTPGAYVVEADAAGFKPGVSGELNVGAGQSVNFDFALAMRGHGHGGSFGGVGGERLSRGQCGGGGPLGDDADSGSAVFAERDFAAVDRRHAVAEFQGGGEVSAAGFVPGDAGAGGSASGDARDAGQQYAERPEGRDGHRGDHAVGAGGVRTGRGAEWIGRRRCTVRRTRRACSTS